MPEISTFRLYLMRGLYALIAVGLGITVVPGLLQHPIDLPLMRGVVRSLLSALALLALLGVRYPTKMLPLLLFEFAWKVLWVLAIFLPVWFAHRVDADTWQTFEACFLGVLLCPLIIPWRYVRAAYFTVPGDRWRSAASSTSGDAA